jgi:hypothetical protein
MISGWADAVIAGTGARHRENLLACRAVFKQQMFIDITGYIQF